MAEEKKNMYGINFYQLIHYGPIGTSFIILWITINSFNCLIKWFYPKIDDQLSIFNLILFLIWPIIIFYHYFRAIFLGPGFLSKKWRPINSNDEKYLLYCKICEGFKAPRSHHCRKCHRCIIKLDHHCPWINTCVGYNNHRNFCYFLFFSIVGCIHALLMICPCIYRVLFIPYYPYTWIRNEPFIQFTFMGLISSILSIGFAIGVIISVGFLLLIQLKTIIYNRTRIENYILSIARHRDHQRIEPFIYPYDLGIKENIRQIFNHNNDGLTWPIRSNCDQYTLIREQLEQNLEKKQRSVRYKIIQSYNGSIFALNYDFYTCLNIPCLKESRLLVKKDDFIRVTHWEKYWLYGTQIKSNEDIYGWFPRYCVDETFDINEINFQLEKKLS